MNAVAESKQSAWILNVSESAYHADPCETPSLNQSTAHLMLTRSPLHAWHQHPRLGKAPRESTNAQTEGTVLHAILLGKGEGHIEVLDFPDYKTKAAQIRRDEVINEGRTPVIKRKWETLAIAAERIRKNLADEGFVLEGGMAEVSFQWHEQGEHGLVVCRGRLDYLILGERGALILDPKKITQADLTTCMWHAKDYGLAIQRAAYTSAVEKYRPDLAGRVDFRFGFHEIDEPYAVASRDVTGVFREIGERRWRRAVLQWEECLRTNKWPGYLSEPLDATIGEIKEEENYANW